MKTFRLLLVGFLFTTWIAWPIQAGLAQDSVPISDELLARFEAIIEAEMDYYHIPVWRSR